MFTFFVMFYLIVGMALFTYKVTALKSLGLLDLVIDAVMEDIQSEVKIKKEDLPVAKDALFVVLCIMFILLWPFVIFSGEL